MILVFSAASEPTDFDSQLRIAAWTSCACSGRTRYHSGPHKRGMALTSRSHFSRSDRPDWLICNHDVLPGALVDSPVDCLQLLRHHLNGDSLLPLSKALPTAKYHSNPVVQRTLRLASDEVVFFPQCGPAFAMP